MNNALIYLLAMTVITVFSNASEAPKKDAIWESTREEMLEWSRQLNVSCVYCHNAKDYKDPSMKTFKVAKDHSQIVKMLNRDYKNNIPKVDCYMCHRGKTIPDYKEKVQSF